MASSINAITTGSGGVVTTADNSGILNLQSNGTTVATVGPTGFSTPSGQTISVANTFGFKNRIINGGMSIDQRNVGASVTPGVATNTYLVDRWSIYPTQASKLTAQQNQGSVTPPAGFINYLGVTSSSAYSVGVSDFFIFRQFIEGLNGADLGWGTANAKTCTLSFWVRSSLTGTFGGAIYNVDGTRSYPFTYIISSANTWTQASITIPGDTTGTWLTTNGVGITVSFNLGSGSNFSGTANAWAAGNYFSATGATSVVGTNGATLYFTGVQFEIGSQATSFDFRDFGRELILCQRYYQKSVPIDVVPGTGTGIYTYGAVYSPVNSGTSQAMWNRFPVQMRAAPSMAIWSSNNSTANQAWSEITQNNLSFSISGQGMNSLGFGANPTGSGVNANIYYLTYTATAEL